MTGGAAPGFKPPSPQAEEAAFAAPVSQEELWTWQVETRRLGIALAAISRFIYIEPTCLQESIRHVLNVGWPNITWKRKYTALHLAAELGKSQVIALLVLLQADLNAVDSRGRTPLDMARRKHHWPCIQALMQVASVVGKNCDTDDQAGPSSAQEASSSSAPVAHSLPTPAFLGFPSAVASLANSWPEDAKPEPAPDPADERMKELARLMDEADWKICAMYELTKFTHLESPLARAVRSLVVSGSAWTAGSRSRLQAPGRGFGPELLPLHLAVAFGRDDVMPLMVALGADVDAVDPSTGLTALEYAKALSEPPPNPNEFSHARAVRLLPCIYMLEGLQCINLGGLEELASRPPVLDDPPVGPPHSMPQEFASQQPGWGGGPQAGRQSMVTQDTFAMPSFMTTEPPGLPRAGAPPPRQVAGIRPLQGPGSPQYYSL